MKNLTVLVIERNEEIKSSLREILKTGEALYIEAESVEEAIRVLAAEKVNLVIIALDLHYRKEGLQLINQVRKIYRKTIYILVMGESASDGLTQALLAGADGILRKPFQPEDVFPTVEFLRRKSQEVAV